MIQHGRRDFRTIPGIDHIETPTWPVDPHGHPGIECKVDGGYVGDVFEIVEGSGEVIHYRGALAIELEIQRHRCAGWDVEVVQEN